MENQKMKKWSHDVLKTEYISKLGIENNCIKYKNILFHFICVNESVEG